MPLYRLMTPAGSIPLATRELKIGSSPDCQIRAEGPDVASHHARMLVRENLPPLVVPCSAACRVFIGGHEVGDQAELAPGSILRVGYSEFHLELSTQADLPLPQPRQPFWKRLVRWSLYAAGAVFLLIALVLILIPVVLSEARVKQKIKDTLEKELRRDISIGSVELELMHGLRIHDLQIKNKEGFSPDKPFLVIKEVDVRAEVWAFLRSRFRQLSASVTLRDPALYLEREAKGTLNTIGMFEDADASRPEGEKETRGAGSKEQGESLEGPLGPIRDLSFKLAVENGSVVFDDKRADATGSIEGMTVQAEVLDFNVPELRGRLSYDLSMAAPYGPHPGKISARGATDFDFKKSHGKNLLGLDVEQLSGEGFRVDMQDLDLGGFAKCLSLPTPGATSMQLVVTPKSAKPLALKIDGWVDTPQLNAAALGLGNQPIAGVGARITIDGQADVESGNGTLTITGQSPLWQALRGELQVRQLPALALAAGGASKPDSASHVAMNFKASADVATLTSRELGRLLGAKAPIAGQFNLEIKSDGPVTDLPVTIHVGLAGLTVPRDYTNDKELPSEDVELRASSRVSLDPATLNLRRAMASATLTSAAMDGRLVDVTYVPASANASRQLRGEVALKANFRKVLDRYRQVLTLPPLDEDLTVTASAREDAGLIALHAEAEIRQVSARPDPITVTADSTLEAGSEWNFQNLKIVARTPESSALDLQASGQVRQAFSTPEFSLQIGAAQADLGALRARLDQLIGLGGEKLARIGIRGQLALSGGEIKGTAEKLSTKLTMDLTGLEVSGLGADGKEKIVDSKARLDLNADVEPDKHSLVARTVSLTSSICSLNLAGEVRDWTALLGQYKFSLDADAQKTVAVLRALGLFDADLAPKGKANIALSADTKAGTITLDRFLIDTDLATVQIASPEPLRGFRVERLLVQGDTEPGGPFDELSGEIAIEKCLTDLAVLSKLRRTIPAIPQALSGSGPVSLIARASGSKGKIAVAINADVTKAEVNFTDLINKPSNVPASVLLEGDVLLDAESEALRIAKLEARLGELLVTGSGSSAVDFSATKIVLNVPKFVPENVRAMFPPLADFTFGGKVECIGLNLSGNIKAVLDSKEDVFAGRLAGLDFGGKVRLDDASFESRQLPYMKLRADGPVEVNTTFVKLDGLSAGIVHKRTQQEARLTVVKGTVTSSIKDGRLLSDLHRLCVSGLEAVSPEVKVHEVLLALETPAGFGPKAPSNEASPPAPVGARSPAGLKPGSAAVPVKPGTGAKPYDFLAGHVIKDSAIKVGRVSYLNYVLTDLSGALELKGNVGRVYAFKAKAYRGDIAGSVSADLNVPGIGHSGEIKPTGVDVDSAATEIMAYKDIFHGKLSGTVAWTGVGFKPGEFSALDGKVQLRYDDGLVRNIEKFPPLREAAGAMVSDLFVASLLKELNASEFKLVPAELILSLEALDGKPVIRAKDKTVLRTIEADPLEVGLLGGLWLFPDVKGEFPFVQDTRMYVQRAPDKWMDKISLKELIGGVRGEKTDKLVRGLIQDGAKDGKWYVVFRGTVQDPKIDKSSFAKDLLKDPKLRQQLLPAILDIVGSDNKKTEPPKNEDGNKKKDKKDDKDEAQKALEDLLKKKLKLPF